MRVISGYVKTFLSSGACSVPQTPRTLYAIPSHFNALFKCGGQWVPLWTNPAITNPLYKRSISTETDSSGRFTIGLPAVSETYQPSSETVTWTLLDPLTQVAFAGIVDDSIPDGGADLKTLLSTYGWTMTPSNVLSYGAANLRMGTVDFDQSTGNQQAVTLVPPMPSATYAPTASGATDDLSDVNYQAFIVPGWTASEFLVRIDAVPPVGRTVKIPYIVLG